MVFLDFVYGRHAQGRPAVFFCVDGNDSKHVEKLKNVYDIHIRQEQRTKANHAEWVILPESLNKARDVLNTFFSEVLKGKCRKNCR